MLFIEPTVIAHRGASAYAPENTLSAFLKAKEFGAHWVEFDVMLTADHEVVVIHDEELDRTTNGSGRVCDYSYQDLKKLDAGSWFNPSFSGEKIPSLREVIAFLHKYQLAANIEIKAFPGQEDLTVKKVLSVVKQCWKTDMPVPFVSSFSLPVLRFVRQYSSTCLLGFLMDTWLSDWEMLCDELNCISVNINEKILTQENIKQIKATGRLVLAYTVNNLPRAQELFGWGVGAVFTDVPDKILLYVQHARH